MNNDFYTIIFFLFFASVCIMVLIELIKNKLNK